MTLKSASKSVSKKIWIIYIYLSTPFCIHLFLMPPFYRETGRIQCTRMEICRCFKPRWLTKWNTTTKFNRYSSTRNGANSHWEQLGLMTRAVAPWWLLAVGNIKRQITLYLPCYVSHLKQLSEGSTNPTIWIDGYCVKSIQEVCLLHV